MTYEQYLKDMGLVEKPRIGWWATHPFFRRGVDTLTHFCGWNTLLKAVESTEEERAKVLFATIFETGGRINEVLSLNRDNFKIKRNFIEVLGMTVLKKYNLVLLNYDWEPPEYSSAYITKRIDFYRNFPIRRKEPLSYILVEYLEKLGEYDNLFSFKYDTGYNLICKIQKKEGENSGPWWPHRLRGERACQLVMDYNFTSMKLKKFFQWSTDEIPLRYVHLSTESLKQSMRGDINN